MYDIPSGILLCFTRLEVESAEFTFEEVCMQVLLFGWVYQNNLTFLVIKKCLIGFFSSFSPLSSSFSSNHGNCVNGTKLSRSLVPILAPWR